MKIKRGKKHTVILMTIALLALIVTGAIGNPTLGGLAVVFGMAVVASVVTAKIGDFMRKRKEDS